MLYIIGLIVLIFVVVKIIDLVGSVIEFLKKYALAIIAVIIAGIVLTVLDLWGIFIPVAVVFCIIKSIVKKLTYKSRVSDYVFKYTYDIVNNIDKQNRLTEVSFFAQPKVRRFLGERNNVGEDTNYHYLQCALRNSVLSSLKNYFCSELSNTGDRMFFFYEYAKYTPYLYEHNMNLPETLESFQLVNSHFLYIEDEKNGDGVFFSQNAFDVITQSFIPFLEVFPELSGVPFSRDYLFDTMYSYGFLNTYIPDEFLNFLRDDPELYEGDFLLLYSAIANEEIRIALDNGQVKPAPKQNEDDEDTFILNHENENGIIEEEYGQQCEQHRVSMDVEMSAEQENELAGCPK